MRGSNFPLPKSPDSPVYISNRMNELPVPGCRRFCAVTTMHCGIDRRQINYEIYEFSLFLLVYVNKSCKNCINFQIFWFKMGNGYHCAVWGCDNDRRYRKCCRMLACLDFIHCKPKQILLNGVNLTNFKRYKSFIL